MALSSSFVLSRIRAPVLRPRHSRGAAGPSSAAERRPSLGLLAVAAGLTGKRRLSGSRVAMGGMMRMISAEEALPGRQEELPISEKHYVLGTPMKGPWPEGHEPRRHLLT